MLLVFDLFGSAFNLRNPAIKLFASPSQLGFVRFELGMLLPKVRLLRIKLVRLCGLIFR
jgi:hypothetical protein